MSARGNTIYSLVLHLYLIHFRDSFLPSDVCQGDSFGIVNSHSEPVPHVSLRTEERREDPVPVYTPTGPVSLATKQRHGRAGDGGGSSVDPEDTTPDHSAVDTGR